MFLTKKLDRQGFDPKTVVTFHDPENPWWSFSLPYVVWQREGRPLVIDIQISDNNDYDD